MTRALAAEFQKSTKAANRAAEEAKKAAIAEMRDLNTAEERERQLRVEIEKIDDELSRMEDDESDESTALLVKLTRQRKKLANELAKLRE